MASLLHPSEAAVAQESGNRGGSELALADTELRRCDPQARWLSTNHLVGEGYWVWLIPLASGSHSVGIVADPTLHPPETLNTFDKAMAWFKLHQPQLYADLDAKRDGLQDFAFFKRFSYGCKKVFDGKDRVSMFEMNKHLAKHLK